jgi:hypothetical protein
MPIAVNRGDGAEEKRIENRKADDAAVAIDKKIAGH